MPQEHRQRAQDNSGVNWCRYQDSEEKRTRGLHLSRRRIRQHHSLCRQRYDVVTEGNKEHFFEARNETNTPESVQQAGEDVEEEVALPKRSHVLEEEIQAFKSAGVEIDDDNEPAPENVPVPTAPTLTEDTVMKEWGFSGFCYRRRDGNRQSPATINRSRDAWSTMRRIDYFLLFFPVDYVKDKMLAEMNKKIRKGRPQITWWEYLRWLGIWELLATTEGHSRSAFWRKDVTCDYAPDHRFEGAPFRLFDLMSYNRFTEILEVHTLYDEPLRTDFVDRFAQERSSFDMIRFVFGSTNCVFFVCILHGHAPNPISLACFSMHLMFQIN